MPPSGTSTGLATLGASCGAVLALNLVFLLACWGFLGLLLFLLITTGGDDAIVPARKALLIIGGDVSYTLGGYQGTPVERISPFTFDPGEPRFSEDRFRARLSPQGERHPVTLDAY